MSLSYISQQIIIYGGLFLMIGGIVGNGINIAVFSSVRIYRRTPGTFYFLIASIFNLAYVTINLIPRIIISGFDIDLTRTSTIWCKIRFFCLTTFTLIIVTCSCLATIDQFFLTSRNVNLRRYSSMKWAHHIVFIVIIVWCLHGILPLWFQYISPITNICVYTDPIYAIYSSIYLLGLVCIIPVSIMTIFGYLIYRHIHSIRLLAEQQVDRHLVKMTLIQVILLAVTIVPYGINSTYGLITSKMIKDDNRLLIESFISTIVILIVYIYYAVCVFFGKYLNESFSLIRIFLGKLLHIFDLIKSFSSSSQRQTIFLAKTKSDSAIATAYCS